MATEFDKNPLGRIVPCGIVPESFQPQSSMDTAPYDQLIKPETINQLDNDRVRGRVILDACEYLGSYGMGGPGFFGLKLSKTEEHPIEWLVLCMWGATHWLVYEGQMVGSFHAAPHQPSWKFEDFKKAIVDASIVSFDCKKTTTDIQLRTTNLFSQTGNLHIPDPSPSTLKLNDDVNLRDAWIIVASDTFPDIQV